MAEKHRLVAEKPESKKQELIAIFRLEFYRKQKNWKFCHDMKGKTPPATPEKEKPKHILNETYNIDKKVESELEPDVGGEGDHEDEPDLNQAFFDAGPDRNTEDWDPPTTVSSQVWYNSNHMQIQQDRDWDHQIYHKPDKLHNDNWHDALQEWYPSPEYSAQALPDLEYKLCWPTHAQLCADQHVPTNMDYFEVGPQIVDLDSGSCQEQLVSGSGSGEPLLNQSWFEHRHWPTPATTFHTSQSDATLESLSEFVRGAAGVPHSSETDLLIYSDEAHKRTFILEGCDEYPTRDNDPSVGTHDFVAGSFMNVAEGRGRGRLRGERVIRIGMGRPYRLN